MPVKHYNVSILSGGNLRHYEVSAVDWNGAYLKACEEDSNWNPGRHDKRPPAVVVRFDGQARQFNTAELHSINFS